ncbi:MAG: helix-turn-helix transcriptional regulator [Piscinibacter sp.]|uniref:helix-turn-helix transcriptional regulator n=1 Tax=Piscinibacter TaxID=1114981 RepID=UPI000FDE1189|nr:MULTISPECIES: helix-turn-helix transcriptional regulator [Piscinibacter]MCW5665803.1 helix-turn-helix transcriptional regulator [Piscinibacter sp.]
MPQPLPAGGDAETRHALAGLIGAIGRADFASAALDALNTPLQAATWSVYRVWRDRAPVLHASASRGVADVTHDCFRAYHAGLYRHDRSFDRVDAAAAPGHVAVLHMRAEEAPTSAHREQIYRAHGMLERLSAATREDDGSLLAVNLYHHAHQGPFGGLERERFEALAPLLMAAVQRHLALAARPLPRGPREVLQQACPALTARELDVCERLLRGWTHDGIAADLGLSLATVKTYRARAFERLGLHFRSELFARFGATGCPPLG